MKVARVKEMQAMDRHAMEILMISEEILMENAGQAAVFVLDREIGIRGRRYAVICGTGNNGGDGFVVARKIHSLGGLVQVYLVGDENRCRGAARLNLDILKRLHIHVLPASSVPSMRKGILHSDGIVDALFGTGLARDIQGIYRDLVALINAAGKKVLSLDIPSGIHGDTGNIMGVAVKADYTVAFGLPKVGNLLYPGYGLCGRLYVSHISFPPALYDREDL
jgi:NAD(P)H-hydrate epimerase